MLLLIIGCIINSFIKDIDDFLLFLLKHYNILFHLFY